MIFQQQLRIPGPTPIPPEVAEALLIARLGQPLPKISGAREGRHAHFRQRIGLMRRNQRLHLPHGNTSVSPIQRNARLTQANPIRPGIRIPSPKIHHQIAIYFSVSGQMWAIELHP